MFYIAHHKYNECALLENLIEDQVLGFAAGIPVKGEKRLTEEEIRYVLWQAQNSPFSFGFDLNSGFVVGFQKE